MADEEIIPTPPAVNPPIPPAAMAPAKIPWGLVGAVLFLAVVGFLSLHGCVKFPLIGQAPVTAFAPAGSTITDSPTGLTVSGPGGKAINYPHRPEAHPKVVLPGPGAPKNAPATVLVPHSGFCLVPGAGVGFDTQAGLSLDAGVEFAYLDDILGLEGDISTSTDLKTWRQSLRLNARPLGTNVLFSFGPSGKLGTFSVDGLSAAVKVSLWD